MRERGLNRLPDVDGEGTEWDLDGNLSALSETHILHSMKWESFERRFTESVSTKTTFYGELHLN